MSQDAPKKPAVVAAGALCWRERQGKLEILLIHRPKYDDWSWPKGKQDPGETVPETAVREVQEEVGLEVQLGAPLARTDYTVKAGLKHVHYWAAEVSEHQRPQPDHGEVDELRWATPKKARKLLTNPTDVQPLESLEALHAAGDLSTRRLLLLRHAKAKPRSSWNRPEGERPLAATGKRQAVAVARLLACWKPTKVVSSPWTRCMQTVGVYARAQGLPIKEQPKLTEAEHQRKPAKAAKVIEKQYESSADVLVCTHRPVLPTLLEALSQHLDSTQAKALPRKEPWLQPGELLVLTISRAHPERTVSVERFAPHDD